MQLDNIRADARLMRAADLLFRLENVHLCRWHSKARVVMGTATFFDAFDALSLAFVLPVLIGLWHISPAQVGLLIAAGYLGQVIGALFFGWLAERIGRIRSAGITIGLMSVMSIACAFTGSLHMLFLARFIQGIGVGGEVPVAATYINELSQTKGRGRFFMLYELIFPIGLLGAAQIGSYVVPRYGWECMFLVGGLPGLIITYLIFRLPESPRWLIGRSRYAEAERIIVDIEAVSPGRHIESTERAAVAQRVSEIAQSLQNQKKRSWKELFSPIYRTRTLVVWVLWASAYFIANGINNWLPTLYKTVYHLPLQEALHMASLSNVLSTCAVVCCALTIDRIGRRRWAIGSFCVAGLLLLGLVVLGTDNVINVMILASSAYAVMGTTTVMLYLYTPEIYPTRMRAIGTGLATSWLRAASAAAPAMVGVVLARDGIATVFLMFAATTVVGLVAAWRMIETSNRSLEEISP
ncbi:MULTISPECIES: MFS transporter [unclassified Undibacterium]|uniref:MFS transporter n=1 Tax=unclassified Undibacterium TaxID=2630295 RepID=UPI002AC998A9|nr:MULTISPECIES: MFS transporter [unclassified Undibacterium]MEB0139873.1 MFS transporter [Undibacterium sp. CCC2.1]MEB0171858.1 MFS transporter [Undibacterium sp. CCC1.1]MEB0175674.1 MFS transporter [Undibacterium sp. CCC3.4]MEB0217282.1 MFS transporter [Undibacterium sp. 5I2]WPX45581.1 MFS transporter [Undibacterium sp. CCC3.4]